MFSHFTLGSNDLERSAVFYRALLAPLATTDQELRADVGMLRITPDGNEKPSLFVVTPFDDLPATWSNGFHLAFAANSTDAVDACYAAGLSAGGTDDGAPGIRAEYQPGYYAAYLRDPDGNKLQAVCYTDRLSETSGNFFSHTTVGFADAKRERKFYYEVLAPLGIELSGEDPDTGELAFSQPGKTFPVFYVVQPFNQRPPTWGNGTHVAFKAESTDAVDAFHAAALANGGTCEGPPGLRPQYAPGYYGAYVRDAVGNKLQAVHRATS